MTRTRTRKSTDPSVRFDRFVEKGPHCWKWTGYTTPTGYGRFQVGGRSVPAHRFAYERANGSAPSGLVVRHTCDNRVCVNPAHLLIGSQAENLADMVERGRDRKARGERAGKAKLTAEAVRDIRRRDAEGEPHPSIARAYGVSTPAVWAIARRKKWAHVQD